MDSTETLDERIASAADSAVIAATAPDDPKARIAYIGSRKIQGFVGTIDAHGEYLSTVYQEVKSLSAQITADYHGRFLIELIQNGADAHSKTRTDGEIDVLLDLGEGEHGVLYVANRGGPFSSANVDALCEMGRSSKTPGEAIGNKGLGFRSVSHITDVPESTRVPWPTARRRALTAFASAS